MEKNNRFDVIIIGGSYSGLAAGMALGRSLRRVIIVDHGNPCNKQTPYSHNFITQDGIPPEIISSLAKEQVLKYNTVQFFHGTAVNAVKDGDVFQVQLQSGHLLFAQKLIFATGIRDLLPSISGLAACWGTSVLHCPYCHGYEESNKTTGILGNGEYAFEFSRLIWNWTKDLTVFTNGRSELTDDQTERLHIKGIRIVEQEIARIEHDSGHIRQLNFKDGTSRQLQALYAHVEFEQHCKIPQQLGCLLNSDGYIGIDGAHQTNIAGVYACGDNVTRMRTVANAVAMGTTTGMMVNKELLELF